MNIYWRLRASDKSGEVELGDVTTLGRAKDNEVYLLDPRLSRHHARIVREGERFVLEDLGSRNGTVLNGERVERAVLKPGDEIQIGDSSIRFGEPPPAAGPASTKDVPSLLVVHGAGAGIVQVSDSSSHSS